ncbi:MAG: D-alanyl-D-alanine carboxypeptidase family protein [Ruminococcaceae bacterium]|nr:D-alanyl-D-alanine carboxypeptidase family protein [Oscillospiraceae bacterium]
MNYREEPDAHLLAKKRQYMKRTKKFKTFIIAFVCLTIVAVWALIGWAIYKLSQDYSPIETTDSVVTTVAETQTVTEEVPVASGSFYEGAERIALEIKKDQMYSGSLIIVTEDADRAYRATGADIVTLLGAKSRCYKIVDNSIKLERAAFDAAEEMFNAFYKETGNGNYHLRMAHFDAPSEKCVSEHLTGYAFDMNIYDGTPTALDAAGAPYDWIYENCAKYGYILRYPGSDNDHFRYVGKGHSAYIDENGLTLDEYVGLLQRHMYGDKHLSFSYDGVDYECFYVMLDGVSDSVKIEIPKDASCTVSGDNASGVIVMLYK